MEQALNAMIKMGWACLETKDTYNAEDEYTERRLAGYQPGAFLERKIKELSGVGSISVCHLPRNPFAKSISGLNPHIYDWAAVKALSSVEKVCQKKVSLKNLKVRQNWFRAKDKDSLHAGAVDEMLSLSNTQPFAVGFDACRIINCQVSGAANHGAVVI